MPLKLIRSIIINVFLLSVILLLPNRVFAQNENAEALFKRGAIRFKQGKYVSSSLDFKYIVNNYNSSPRVIPAYMMLANTFFQLGEFEMAGSTAIKLRDQYPQSRYTEWTYYFTAACKFRTGEVNQAASILSELAGKTDDKTLRLRSLSAIRYTILPVADEDVIYRMLEKNGITRSDIDNVQQFDSSVVQSKEFERLPDVGSHEPNKKWESSQTFKIGLLSPLTGMSSDLGIQLAKGVQTALKNHSDVSGKGIELIIEDTESDPVTAILKTYKLIDEGVIAIIGPVLSESTFAPAEVSQEHGNPFIAPTTTHSGLTRLGRYIFQLNFNPVIQAEALADLAINTFHFSTFAVIAINDKWGVTVAETFSREMVRQGAVNIRTVLLSHDRSLLDDETLMKIRENAPESMAVVDSLLIKNYGNAFPDTVMFKFEPILRGERKLEPINSIDCIFVSATSEYAVQIASRLMEYNINTVLLGDSGWWSSENAFVGAAQYIEGAYVVAPAGELSGGAGLSYFSDSSFAVSLRRTGVSRSRDTYDIPLMKGADACNLIIHCLQNGAQDPVSLVKMLESIQDFKGVSSLITIDPKRHTNLAEETPVPVEDPPVPVENPQNITE